MVQFLVFLKKIIEEKFITSKIGIYLAFIYTIGHILIAMTCNRLLTGAPLNLAAIDAVIEPLINGFWFYLLFEVFNKYKQTIQNGSASSNNNSSISKAPSKLAPINNKKNLD